MSEQWSNAPSPSQTEFDALSAQVTDIYTKSVNHQNLGTFANISELNTLITAKLATLSSYTSENIRVNATADCSPFANTIFYEGCMYRSGSANYGCVMWYPNAGASGRPIVSMCTNGTWTHESLALSKYSHPHEIAEGTDLNDLVTPGMYHSSSTARTATLLNKPSMVSAGFSLEVMKKGNYITQIMSSGTVLFSRGSGSVGFTDWVSLITDSQFKYFAEIAKSSSKTLSVGNNSRSVLITMGNGDARMSLVLAFTNSSGGTTLKEIYKGSEISFDVSTANQIVVSNASTTQGVQLMGIQFNPSSSSYLNE